MLPGIASTPSLPLRSHSGELGQLHVRGSAASAAEPLTCLYKVNCDRMPAERKRAWSTSQNIEAFIDLFGVDVCGLFTVTFPDRPDSREAQRRVHNFHRRVLADIFGEFVRVREFHREGVTHYHFVVQCFGDIRSGFDFEHYLRVQAWSRGGRKGSKPRGVLGRNALLKGLHGRLNRSAKAYGIGFMELAPIRSKGEAVGKYLGGYLTKGNPHKPADAKRTRDVTYSQGFSRRVKGAWAWYEDGWLWRAKVAYFAKLAGISSYDGLSQKFGPRWAHRLKDEITNLPLPPETVYPSLKVAARDGRDVSFFPADAVNIQFSTCNEPLRDYRPMPRFAKLLLTQYDEAPEVEFYALPDLPGILENYTEVLTSVAVLKVEMLYDLPAGEVLGVGRPALPYEGLLSQNYGIPD